MGYSRAIAVPIFGEMKLLDLFCGRGGWTKGFMEEGFQCVGIDLVNKQYPGEIILADLRTFHPKGEFDVIVSSPPCAEFSVVKTTWRPRGLKADLGKGLELVDATFRIIREVEPKIWILENVRSNTLALELLPYEPFLEFSHSKRGRRWLWSNMWTDWADGRFPMIHEHRDERDLENRIRDPWKRAEISLPVARMIARVVKAELCSGN